MSQTHMTLCLLNPAFNEEEGVTIENGKPIAFTNTSGEPRMFHVKGCETIPAHAGLHSAGAVRRNSSCKRCRALWKLMWTDNEAFNQQISKPQV